LLVVGWIIVHNEGRSKRGRKSGKADESCSELRTFSHCGVSAALMHTHATGIAARGTRSVNGRASTERSMRAV